MEMRKKQKLKQKQAIDADFPSSSPSTTPELSILIEFLNELSRTQVADFKAHILSKWKFKLSINPKNLDEEITPEEFCSFTSVTSEHGKWFFDCFIL